MAQFTPAPDPMAPILMSLLQDKLRQQTFERTQNARIAQEQRQNATREANRVEDWKKKLALEGIDPSSPLENVAAEILRRNKISEGATETGIESAKAALLDRRLAPLAAAGAQIPPTSAGAPGTPGVLQAKQDFSTGIVGAGIQNDPEALNRLGAMMTGQRAEMQATDKRIVAQERRGELQRAREGDITATAQRIAGEVLGLTETEGTRAFMRDRLVKQYGTKEGGRMFAAATNRAEAMAIDERLRAKGLQGRSKIEALTEIIMDDNPGLEKKQARSVAAGLSIVDPFASEKLGRSETIQLRGRKADKVGDGRLALLDLINRLDIMEGSFAELGDEPLVGSVVGLDQFQDVFRGLGIQSGGGAAYMSQMREFVSILLRARQGSRPSDYDLYFYMSLLPSLTEVNAESAVARFGAMRQSLEMQALTGLDPELRDELGDMRVSTPVSVDRKLMAAAEGLEDELQSAAPGSREEAEAVSKFMQTHQKWKQTSPNVTSMEDVESMLELSDPGLTGGNSGETLNLLNEFERSRAGAGGP